MEPQTAPTPPSRPVAARLMSVDALRGFDMFWILGANSLVWALHQMAPTHATEFLNKQLDHATWAGLNFYDLIFPLFVFIVGVSLVFSLTKTIAQEGRRGAIKRIARRSLLLFALGIFYNGGFSHGWPDVRLMGVLQRIAIAYFFSALLFCFLKPRGLAVVCAGPAPRLLGAARARADPGYRVERGESLQAGRAVGRSGHRAFAFEFLDHPQPGKPGRREKDLLRHRDLHGGGNTSRGLNFANHFDFEFLPGRKYDTFYDPEGYLSNLPTIATCLMGVFAGLLLRDDRLPGMRKCQWLAVAGATCVIIGWIWGLELPVIKKIWTSSFAMVAAGYSALLLALFYFLIDLRSCGGGASRSSGSA